MRQSPYINLTCRSLLNTLSLCFCCLWCSAQKERTVIAGPQYNRPQFHQWLWGQHYRKEWTTPVRIQQLNLDTSFGGLKPNQAAASIPNTLQLRDASGQPYVLRKVNKGFDRTIPDIYKGTFIENLTNDQVSMGHPYGAVTIPRLAAAAGIYHTQPIIRFVPRQPALDSFNTSFGDQLHLLEQQPAGNWENAANFGHAKNIISTEDLFNALLNDNSNLVDQHMYVRARLFDMFIGDWSRHEEQWTWATVENNGKTYYQAIPHDRDQAYSKIEGRLLRIALSAAGLSHLQTFQGKMKDVNHFNFPARYLDRRIANEASLQVWISNATDIQKAMTDEVIESAIRELPAEVFAISGQEIITKLKSRREELIDYARAYYKFLAREVDVPGTVMNEYFEINYLDEKQVRVSVYALNANGVKAATPHYIRTFSKDETTEVRLYGIGGNDQFRVSGNPRNAIAIRIIGSKEKDIISDASGNRNVHVYDDKQNIFNTTNATRMHLSDDDAVHVYNYEGIKYDRSSIAPTFFFSNYDRFYIGLTHKITKHAWRKEPYAYHHVAWLRHSITQKAPSAGYAGVLTGVIGKWDLLMNLDYDGERWLNFYGIGNETPQVTRDRNFYRMRYREIYTGIGLGRSFKNSNISFTPFYQGIRVLRDDDRFIAKSSHNQTDDIFTRHQFAGLKLNYNLALVDNNVIPSRGIEFFADASHTYNLKESGLQVTRYTGNFNFYVPFGNHLVLASRSGAATLTGDPKFFQLNNIGGSQNLRGFRRERFWGHTTAFSANELQYQFDVRSSIFNGRAAVFGLYDIGRVWERGEQSDLWHTAYGAGLMIAPFNRIMASASFAVSKENRIFHLRLNRSL